MDARNSYVIGFCIFRGGSDGVLFAGMVIRIGDENNRFGAVLPCVDRFADQFRMKCVSAMWIRFLWIVTEDDHSFAAYINSGVVIVVEFRRRDAVTHKGCGTVKVGCTGKADRDEFLIDLH